MIVVEQSPSGRVWYVVERSGDRSGHRDTSKSKAGAQRMASELRRGLRVYDSWRGHTVPVARSGGVLDGLLS